MSFFEIHLVDWEALGFVLLLAVWGYFIHWVVDTIRENMKENEIQK